MIWVRIVLKLLTNFQSQYFIYINEMMLDLTNVLTNMFFILNVYNDNNTNKKRYLMWVKLNYQVPKGDVCNQPNNSSHEINFCMKIYCSLSLSLIKKSSSNLDLIYINSNFWSLSNWLDFYINLNFWSLLH